MKFSFKDYIHQSVLKHFIQFFLIVEIEMNFGTVYKYLKRFLCFVRLCFYDRENTM